jgi:hypothetical protein
VEEKNARKTEGEKRKGGERKERETEGRGKRRMLVYNPDFHFFPNS